VPWISREKEIVARSDSCLQCKREIADLEWADELR